MTGLCSYPFNVTSVFGHHWSASQHRACKMYGNFNLDAGLQALIREAGAIFWFDVVHVWNVESSVLLGYFSVFPFGIHDPSRSRRFVYNSHLPGIPPCCAGLYQIQNFRIQFNSGSEFELNLNWLHPQGIWNWMWIGITGSWILNSLQFREIHSNHISMRMWYLACVLLPYWNNYIWNTINAIQRRILKIHILKKNNIFILK